MHINPLYQYDTTESSVSVIDKDVKEVLSQWINYDISKLNPRKNPYAEKLKRQVTINLKSTTVDYFKKLAEETGIPYQNLIDLYLDDCVKKE